MRFNSSKFSVIANQFLIFTQHLGSFNQIGINWQNYCHHYYSLHWRGQAI